MGREIRRVPKHWEHPRYSEDDAKRRDWIGQYRPCHDYDFETKSRQWILDLIAWEAGFHPDRKSYHYHYWEYEYPPSQETCRPIFDADPVCYQVYETVTEGTPASPVFDTKDELSKWLVEQGYSIEAARNFVIDESAPSMIVQDGRVISDIETCAERRLRGE